MVGEGRSQPIESLLLRVTSSSSSYLLFPSHSNLLSFPFPSSERWVQGPGWRGGSVVAVAGILVQLLTANSGSWSYRSRLFVVGQFVRVLYCMYRRCTSFVQHLSSFLPHPSLCSCCLPASSSLGSVLMLLLLLLLLLPLLRLSSGSP